MHFAAWQAKHAAAPASGTGASDTASHVSAAGASMTGTLASPAASLPSSDPAGAVEEEELQPPASAAARPKARTQSDRCLMSPTIYAPPGELDHPARAPAQLQLALPAGK